MRLKGGMPVLGYGKTKMGINSAAALLRPKVSKQVDSGLPQAKRKDTGPVMPAMQSNTERAEKYEQKNIKTKQNNYCEKFEIKERGQKDRRDSKKTKVHKTQEELCIAFGRRDEVKYRRSKIAAGGGEGLGGGGGNVGKLSAKGGGNNSVQINNSARQGKEEAPVAARVGNNCSEDTKVVSTGVQISSHESVSGGQNNPITSNYSAASDGCGEGGGSGNFCNSVEKQLDYTSAFYLLKNHYGTICPVGQGTDNNTIGVLKGQLTPGHQFNPGTSHTHFSRCDQVLSIHASVGFL